MIKYTYQNAVFELVAVACVMVVVHLIELVERFALGAFPKVLVTVVDQSLEVALS
jgi:hypothetical protein